MWTSSNPRTKPRPDAFAAQHADGSPTNGIFGIAATVHTRKDSLTGVAWNGTRSTRPDYAQHADINGAGPRACAVRFGLCIRTGTQITKNEEHSRRLSQVMFALKSLWKALKSS
jgi:hypothetical protein